MRASIAAQARKVAAPARAASATTSRLSIGSTGLPAPRARPWATEQAVRRPVKAPGPRPKAIASRSARRQAGFARAGAMIAGTSAAEALLPPPALVAQRRSPAARATVMRSPAVSNASRTVMRHEFSGRLRHAMMALHEAPPVPPTRCLGAGAGRRSGWRFRALRRPRRHRRRRAACRPRSRRRWPSTGCRATRWSPGSRRSRRRGRASPGRATGRSIRRR